MVLKGPPASPPAGLTLPPLCIAWKVLVAIHVGRGMEGLSAGVGQGGPVPGSSEQMNASNSPVPSALRQQGKSPVQSPRRKRRMLVARNEALGLWRLWGHLPGTCPGQAGAAGFQLILLLLPTTSFGQSTPS